METRPPPCVRFDKIARVVPATLICQEFCVAMHLIYCVRKLGLQLPEPPSVRICKKTPKSKNRTPGATKTTLIKSTAEIIPPRSPKRRSRMAMLVGDDQSAPATRGVDTPKPKEAASNAQEPSALQTTVTTLV